MGKQNEVKNDQLIKRDKPEHLAGYVHTYLQNKNGFDRRLSIEMLTELFEVMYFTSMNTEEGQMIHCSVTFYDPASRNDTAQRDFTSHSWSFAALGTPIEYSVKNLLKLSKAADPWSSSIAVYFGPKNQLLIYGMIDQQIHTQAYIHYESTAKPAVAGFFQASILGIGILEVLYRFDMIATLRHDRLVQKFPHVLANGPVSEALKAFAEITRSETLKDIEDCFEGLEIEDYRVQFDKLCRNTIARLLTQVRKYHHGGAILISNETSGLKVKYPMLYSRMFGAISRYIWTSAERDHLKLNIKNGVTGLGKGGFYVDQQLAESTMQSAWEELKGAIRFIASKTCVDGAVLLNGKYEMQGFGTVIEHLKLPDEVFVLSDTATAASSAKPFKADQLGTRHQSMISYCYVNPGSIGFVVSQDGDIRAITSVGKKVFIWENIRVQRILKIVAKT